MAIEKSKQEDFESNNDGERRTPNDFKDDRKNNLCEYINKSFCIEQRMINLILHPISKQV